jgi:hypothetical protein
MKGKIKMFKEIDKINSRNEEGKALIKVDNIVAMVQQPKHITRLYDENENLVSENEDEPRYAVIVSDGTTHQNYIVSQATYDELKAELLK